MHRFASLVSLGILGLSLTITSATVVAAAPQGGASASLRSCDAHGNILPGPGYYQITGRAGTTTTLYALVGNHGSRSGTIDVVPVGARNGTYGSISLDLPSRRPRGVGSWVTLDTTRVTRVVTAPGRAAVVPFRVRIPAGTRPGQYVGAMTAFVPAAGRRLRNVSLTIQTRVAIGIVVTVPGHQSAGFAGRGVGILRRGSGAYVVAYVRNVGNTLLKGWGYLWVWAPRHGSPAVVKPLTFDLTVPSSTFQYPIHLNWRPANGHYGYVLKLWWKSGQAIQHGGFQLGGKR